MGVTISHCKEEESVTPPSGFAEGKKEDVSPAGEAKSTQAAKEVEKEEDEKEAAAVEESDDEDTEEDEDAQPQIEVKSVPYDHRFPTTNQARNCYTRYNEFYRCKGQKDEEDAECKFYQRAYRSLCPGEWVEKWNEQRENGTWPGKY